MKNTYKISQVVFLIVIICLCCYTKAQAQVDPGLDPDVPIDGGLSLLVAAGVGYGVKKLKSKKSIEKNL